MPLTPWVRFSLHLTTFVLPDGTVTATRPIDGHTLRSHGPPANTA